MCPQAKATSTATDKSVRPTKSKGRPRGRPKLSTNHQPLATVLSRRRPLSALSPPRRKLRLDHVLHSVVLGRRRWLHRRKLLVLDQHLDLVRIENLALNQRPCDPLQRIAIVRDDLLGRGVTLVDQL